MGPDQPICDKLNEMFEVMTLLLKIKMLTYLKELKLLNGLKVIRE